MMSETSNSKGQQTPFPGGRAFLCLWRIAIRCVLLALILVALYVTAGRLLMPLLASQTGMFENRLERMLGVPVSIGSLEGSWFRFSPGFKLSGLDLQLNPADESSRLFIREAELALDLPALLQEGKPFLTLLELHGVELAVEQLPDGRWTLKGLVPGAGDYKDMLVDLLLETPRIGIQEANIEVQLSDGAVFQLNSAYMQLRNDGLEHLASLQVRPGNNNPVLARLEFSGDPRQQYSGKLWIDSNTDELASFIAPLVPLDWDLDALSLDARLWIDFDQSGLLQLVAEANRAAVTASALVSQESAAMAVGLSNASFLLQAIRESVAESAADHSSTAWTIDVHDLAFDWHNNPADIPALQLQVSLDPAAPWRLSISTLDMAMLADLAGSLPLPTAAAEALATLAPVGNLHQVLLESGRDYPDMFALQANFDDLQVEAWQGAPAGRGLAGFLALDAVSGQAEVDATDASIHLPGLFREAWHYDTLNTRVYWLLDDGGFRVGSTPIHVSSRELSGKVQFQLDSRLENGAERVAELSLLVGMDFMDVSIHAAYLPTLERIAPTMEWLDAALQGGRITDSGFILRTPAAGNPPLASATHVSWYNLQDGRLQFLPDWPAVDITTASIRVVDEHATVLAYETRMQEMSVQEVSARVEPLSEGGSLLSLAAHAETGTAGGIEFLRNSPIRDHIGATLDAWEASGSVQADVTLEIPLGAADREQVVEVSVKTQDSALLLQEQELQLFGIDGEFLYSQGTGLSAQNLRASMFDGAVELSLSTESAVGVAGKTISIVGKGMATVAALREWGGQPIFVSSLLGFLEGDFGYEAVLQIPVADSSRFPVLDIKSDLVGVTSSFPQPFDKPASLGSPLELEMTFDPSGLGLQIRYTDWLSGFLLLDDMGIDRGQLHFGPLNQNFNVRQLDASAPGLLVSGEMSAFNYDDWLDVSATISRDSPTGKLLKDYLRLVDVDFTRLHVFGQELENINVQLQFAEEDWQLRGSSDLLAGTLTIPEAGSEPWNVNLDYLRLPAREIPEPDTLAEEQDVEAEEKDLLENVDPSTLPAFHFAAGELSIGEQNLGTWRFTLQPGPQGASITDFHMQELSSTIRGQADPAVGESGGASIGWRYVNAEHQSRFEGVFSATDLAKVLPLWGHDANIESRTANFAGALSWPGSPLAFSLKKASGELGMAINNGRFIDIDSGSSRLLGAFNLDTLVRRLELDFSDIFGRGFTFDSIRGELDLLDGVVHTTTPLVIDGPSSRININGEIDLAAETIMADMQVRIPLGENISLLAGLLGAWPIAVSTYIASKIFADQVEEFTTIIYRLEGPWASPQAGFEVPEEAVTP